MTFGSNPRRPVRDHAFLCILALGAALRLYHVTAPFLDAHAWRQLDTAAMARNFYEGPFFPLDPRVDWGGRSGYLEAEFPLVPAVIAVLYRLFGLHEILGRLLVIATALGLIWCVYRLALALDGRVPVARAAAFLMAISPAAVFFGRIVIPDTPMIFLSALALLGFVEFARTDSRKWLVTGAVALTLACLAEVAGCLPRSAYRRRTGARPRMEGVPRSQDLDRGCRSPDAHGRLVLARAHDLRADRLDDGDPGRADEVLSGLREPRPLAVDLREVEHDGAPH